MRRFFPQVDRLADRIVPAVSVSFSVGVLTIIGDAADNLISIAHDDDGNIRVDFDFVAGKPTLENTETISVSTGAGNDLISIDAPNGLFASVDGDEIDFILDLGAGNNDHLFYFAPDALSDHIDLGTKGINVNGDADLDVSFDITTTETIEIRGLGGDDTISAAGSAVVGGPVPGGVNLEGSSGNDSIIGGDGSDFITGNDGNDTLIGGPGSDGLLGDDGVDSIIGGDGNDTCVGGTGDDFMDAGNDADRVEGKGDVNFVLTDTSLTTEGDDPLGSGDDVISGFEEADLFGGGSANRIDTSAFNGAVLLVGRRGQDALIGAAGNDVLKGGKGADVLTGGRGADTIEAGDGIDRQIETGTAIGKDTRIDLESVVVTGTAAADLIDVSDFTGSTTLDGGDGNDTILAGLGDDSLCGGLGDDSLAGGDGTDRIFESADVDFTLTDTSLTGLGSDVLSAIEEASLGGGGSNNSFTVSSFTGAATLEGGSGDDQVVSTNDADFTLGTTGGGSVVAAGGRAPPPGTPLLTRSTGGAFALSSISRVLLTGGDSNNTFTVGSLAGLLATLDGAGGGDRIVASGSKSTLTDSGLVLTLGDTVAIVNIEEASLSGGIGKDRLDAAGFSGSVTLKGAGGNDRLIGGTGANVLRGGAGNDRLQGGTVIDELTGGSGNDLLEAFAGDDTLLGGPGSDTLNGGEGTDECKGGEVLSECP